MQAQHHSPRLRYTIEMIQVTPIAEHKIIQHLTQRGHGVGIRIGVKTTGCSGYAYTLQFADTIEPQEITNQYKHFSIIIDRKVQDLLQGMIVDYQVKGLNEGFEFINPQEKARCGCGESFTI